MNAQSILRSTAWIFREEARKSLEMADRNVDYIRGQLRAGTTEFTHADYREQADLHMGILRQFNHWDGMVWSLCNQHGIDPDDLPA